MKWYIHLFIYLFSYIAIEIMLVLLFLIMVIQNEFNTNIWYYFGWIQAGVPLISLLATIFIECVMDYDRQKQQETEWYKEVNEMLKEYKKNKER